MPGVREVEGGALPESRNPFSEYGSMDIHRKAFKAAEGLPGLTVIDLLEHFAAVTDDAALFSNDGFHLNQRGHEMTSQILEAICKKD